MGIRNSYENGVFSWVDLMTSEQEAAKQFYAELFGWTFKDKPTDMGGVYSMAYKGDRSVAAISAIPPTMDMPPSWQSYITVKDLDTTVQSCQENGATIEMAPFDVMQAGRMAIIKDPTGAVVSLWQATEHIGAERVNEVNTFCWTELQTRGAERAAEFYKSVFGWELEVDEAPPNYISASVKGHMNCGMFDMAKAPMPDNVPPRWVVYFNVADLDASLAVVNRLGGSVLMDPMDIEPGRFTTILDPQGAVVVLMQVNTPDD
ncbi:VOC family protein [Leptothoe kymatousa]|uniref:VOC family protein n=1 Tax=Leptothoe kymatousa TAU-MAC 1615 TaxID=2364775 RepID=A0ABS5Y3K2_9CYAN|nr:VOC family protein [Leptothoe kymatousa]MBT9312402.1 VOC family protein [Leptothoe kymatousa TAU-MAC 1615]